MPHPIEYNRRAAADYAMRWALLRNPKYPDFSSNPKAVPGGGGDCANFISQCLHAGGWAMIDGWGRRSYAWWATSTEASRPWASAGRIAENLTWRGIIKRCSRSELDEGDLVSYNINGHDYNHWMMITGFRSGPDGPELLYSSHSTDRLNYPLAIPEYELAKSGIFTSWKVTQYIGNEGKIGYE
jgi:hypothetical protein